ncbi:MAG: hypothetical protein J2P17_29010 [Mycobacterium sp.]|nr:hypothetical protein [Mycobacterium sp.]
MSSCRAQLVREVLVTRSGSLARGRIYDRARVLFGNGLATSEGSLHRQRRRLVQPAFHHQRIAGYADAMRRHTAELTAPWAPGQQIAIDRVMHELALRIVAGALFAKGRAVRQVIAEVPRADALPMTIQRRA